MVTKQKAVEILTRQRDRISTVEPLNISHPIFQQWQRDTKTALEQIFNTSRKRVTEFARISFFPDLSAIFGHDEDVGGVFKAGLGEANILIQSCINEVQDFWPDERTSSDTKDSLAIEKHGNSVARAPIRLLMFIGRNGGQRVWQDLRDFLRDRLMLPVDEFNNVSVAGVTTAARLSEMLDQASFAFLVMTAEDAQGDGTTRARENVVHEAGLFQGRLGFEKAIILIEEGCEEFSNIHGLGQIRFPKGKIKAEFEEVRRVLEREGLIQA